MRWAQDIPPSTEVEMTTIKSYGGLRTTRMPMSELRCVKTRFGVQNLQRVPKEASKSKRPWWAAPNQRLFYVGNDRRKAVETAVWRKAHEQIKDSS